MIRYLQYIHDLIFPELCIACRKNEAGLDHCLCWNCKEQLPFLSTPEDSLIALTGKDFFPQDIKNVYSLFHYKKHSAVADMVHRFKYEEKYKVAQHLGALLGITYREYISQSYTIVPVPVHPKRLKKRGYNQAEQIAIGLSNILPVQIINTSLIRTKYESSQIGKNKRQRATDLQSSFHVNNDQLAGKHILLIDDVITTGSTVAACYQALQTARVESVAVASVGISI